MKLKKFNESNIDVKDLQSGDLVKVFLNRQEGIGYIYENFRYHINSRKWIGISWKDGGVADVSIKNAIESGATFIKCNI
jgi:hypothetical protein